GPHFGPPSSARAWRTQNFWDFGSRDRPRTCLLRRNSCKYAPGEVREWLNRAVSKVDSAQRGLERACEPNPASANASRSRLTACPLAMLRARRDSRGHAGTRWDADAVTNWSQCCAIDLRWRWDGRRRRLPTPPHRAQGCPD